MADDGFDFKEFTKFEQNLLSLANDKLPKESKKFLRQEGAKLKKDTLKNAKSKVKKDTGNYFKSIKKGKVYKYDGSLAIRCFSSSPHAHLIEKGHRQVTKNGVEVGWVDGKHVFEETEKGFQNTYYDDAEKFIDEVIDKL